jgi:hypothetical protein
MAFPSMYNGYRMTTNRVWGLIGFISGAALALTAAFATPSLQQTMRQSTLPKPESPQNNGAILVESRFVCQTNAVVTANRVWIEACYVSGKLNSTCQNLFYADGSYLLPGASQAQYDHDETMCACALQVNLAKTLNNQQTDSWNSCSDYPETAGLLW